MTLASLLVHDVTISTPTTTADRYGNQVKSTWTSRTVKGWVSQRSASEDHDHREAAVSDWVLFLDPDETVTNGDRFTWSGITFEGDGPPNPAWTSRGAHHVEIPLRVVTG